jgi:glycosyltransferase involved in cell wall biosynthesis
MKYAGEEVRMKPLITALVDTFNQERYIEQALVSVLDQGLSPAELEIVVVDDGSSDKTPSIVQKFLPRVKYLHKRNGGQASAFNKAFPEVHGQMVALLDGDDWWAHGKLATVIESLEQHPEASAVCHGRYEIQETTNEVQVCAPERTKHLHLETPEAAREASIEWRFLLTSAITVRRKILEQVIPIPEALVFSADAPIAMASVAAGVRLLKQPLFYYRRHSDNQYAINLKDITKMRRRSEMDERMFELLEPMLIGLGVSSESVDALLYPRWTQTSRFNLRNYGGSRRNAFRIETRHFRSTYKKRRAGHRLYKYLVPGLALLLPPRKFYELRDWYAEQVLVRFRKWFCKQT